jgi:hypothetical protein
MKPGIRTTEFWTVIAMNVGILAASLADALPPRIAVYAISVSTTAYAISRGLAKIR